MKDISVEPSAVACVIVNYRSPWDMIQLCLKSVVEDNAEVPCRIILVDNASGDDVIGRVRAEYPSVNIIDMAHNAGFAAAVNRGLEEVEEPFVLMLNTDAILNEGALSGMTAALADAGADVAGIAPKMVSSTNGEIIDGIGIIVPPDGAAFNRGIGQCDLGQYDDVDEVTGACFGACLLRRELFDQDKVGALYEGYFLYFEDSDWCVRAVSQGYRFLTAPDAVVRHLHSGVTRNESLNFKYGLIELNTLKMVTRTMESRLRVLQIVTSRCSRLLARTLIRRKFIGPNLKTMASYLAALPQLLRERGQLKDKRTVPDSKIFDMARGERAYFDTVAYRPDNCIESLIDTYLRLLAKDQDPETGKVLSALYRLGNQAPGSRSSEGQKCCSPGLTPDAETTSLFMSQPTCVQELLRSAGAIR
ncbi:MAG: glycosyltransferase family 2 protein [Thermoleophilia bacterium]|nr:glycosyltransferase family 2 protein [Thermoleophilia bacterium]